MAYDAGLAERVSDALGRVAGARASGSRTKLMFGGYGFLLGRTTFVIVWGEGLLVKIVLDDYAAALAEPGVTAFAPDGGRPMGNWVVVPAERVADDPDLLRWLGRGLTGIGR